MAASSSNHVDDATVLLTGAHIDLLVDTLRSVRVVMQQLDTTNRKLDDSNRELIKALRENSQELKKQRQQRRAR